MFGGPDCVVVAWLGPLFLVWCVGVVGWFFVVLWGFVGCVLGVIVVWFDFGVGGV